MFTKGLIGSVFVVALALPSAALARMPEAVKELPETVKDMAFGRDVAWAKPVDDESLVDMRGSAGLVFSLSYTGQLEFNQPGGAPEGVAVTPNGDNAVQITGGIGNFGGANGVFQFTNVEGSMNVVNNSMVINIAVVNSPSVNLSNLFAGPR